MCYCGNVDAIGVRGDLDLVDTEVALPLKTPDGLGDERGLDVVIIVGGARGEGRRRGSLQPLLEAGKAPADLRGCNRSSDDRLSLLDRRVPLWSNLLQLQWTINEGQTDARSLVTENGRYFFL